MIATCGIQLDACYGHSGSNHRVALTDPAMLLSRALSPLWSFEAYPSPFLSLQFGCYRYVVKKNIKSGQIHHTMFTLTCALPIILSFGVLMAV
ncbi:hypothetical protein QCA50_007266 [Cerrena zonata]|uniref:Uncharacterized protein n=1 Tax=Cerrena zonata TaxID=2478898 RepID=A0AAW0GCT9_9APHY